MNQPLLLNQCKNAWQSFLGVATFGNRGPCVLRPEEYWVVASTQAVHMSGGETIFAGGLVKIFSEDSPFSPKDYRILSSETVLFMALSSYLAESTNDPSVLNYATASATCIKANMLDARTGLVKDFHIDAMNGQLKWGGNLSCMLTGIFIEGLSVLATVSGDYTWRSLAITTAESAMKSNDWHGTDGVLSIVSSGSEFFRSDNLNAGKGLLSRGLMVAYQRNASNKAFRSLVRSYINTQFNALIDLASRDDTYSVSWNGPYIGPYFHGQLAALDTLIAAIAVNR
ncbi:hypothetical protein FRC02_006451 [Tulasnella sp. 418]|nr:hypothetical protein FRC02_006451 [Tulasnella sp. 418]